MYESWGERKARVENLINVLNEEEGLKQAVRYLLDDKLSYFIYKMQGGK